MGIELKTDEIVTFIDDKVIGTRDELIKHLKNQMAYNSAIMDDDENYSRILTEIAEVFQKLVYDYPGNNILLCLFENSTGSLDIKKVEI